MAIGYAHLFVLPPATADSGEVTVPRYQFTFTVGGDSYSKIFDEAALEEFFAEDLGLRADIQDEVMRLLRRDGKMTIPDVDISENDAAAMGLMEVPVDY